MRKINFNFLSFYVLQDGEIRDELSQSQHQRWRGLVLDIEESRARGEEAHGHGSLTPSPVFNFSPMSSPRIGRRVASMSPCSSSSRHINLLNLKNRNDNADIEEGGASVPRTWSLTNLLTPRTYRKTESLPVTPVAHSNPESMHGSYAVTSMVSNSIQHWLLLK